MNDEPKKEAPEAPQQMPRGNPGKVVGTVPLSNGCVVEIRQAIGKNLIDAHRLGGDQGEAGVGFALVCRVAFINGRRITMEEMEAAPIEDCQALVSYVGSGGKASASGPATSSGSGA